MRVWALLVLAALPGCTTTSLFTCADSTQCAAEGVAGRCEATGFCSFADDACESGQRYGDFSGSLSQTCVPADASGSTGPARAETSSTLIPGTGTGDHDPPTGSTSSSSDDSEVSTTTGSPTDGSSSSSTGEDVDEDLLGWWRMDDDPADGVLDSSGNEFHGTCVRLCPSLNEDGSYAFSGEEIIEIPGAELSTPVFTLAAWASPLPSSEYYATMLGRPVGDGFENTWGLAFFGELSGVELVVGGVAQSLNASTTAVKTSGWHHYAGRFDGSTAELFIDGDLAASVDVPEGTYGEDGQTAFIAGEFDNGTLTARYTGSMDDVRFYRRVLTSDEILQLASER